MTQLAFGKKILVGILLFGLLFWMNPRIVKAAESSAVEQSKSVNFEINPISKISDTGLVTMDEIIAADPLVKSLKEYLTQKKSPLAPYAGQIVTLPQWQRALAISFVESNFCRFAANNNCGSLGGAPGTNSWRKYSTPYDGLADLAKLLEKPMYKERFNSCSKMLKVYVVPGSPQWQYGCESKQKELIELTESALHDQISMVISQWNIN